MIEEKNINILFIVSNNLECLSGRIGGGEIGAFEYAKKWKEESKIKIRVIESVPSPSKLLGLDLPVITINLPFIKSLKEGTKLASFLFFLRSIIWLFRSVKSGLRYRNTNLIIAANSSILDAFPAYIISVIKRKPFISFVQITGYKTHSWRDRFTLYLLRKSAVLIAISEPVRMNLINLNFSEKKIILSSNLLVDNDLIKSIKIKDKKYDGCFIGRIAEIKGIDDLLKAWNILIKKKKNYKLIIAGNGSYYNEMCKIVSDEKLDKNIKIAGFLKEKEKLEALKESKLFIHPSKLKEEGSSLSIIEAMACSIPVLSYNNKVHKELFSECKGFIMSPINNAEALADSIDRILSKENIEELGQECKNFSSKYNKTEIIKSGLNKILKIVNLN